MKRSVLVICVAFLAAGAVQAAEFNTNPNPLNPASGTLYLPEDPNITQNSDTSTVTELLGVACGAGGISAENYFLRRFFLNADHSIALQYNVTSVDLGIESVNVYVGTGAPISANLYSIANGAAFTFANMTQIGTNTRDFPDGTALVVENFPVTGAILDPMGEDLVVAMYFPDTVDAYGIWPGANSNGQTQPCYLAAVDCGVAEPTAFGDIGFGDVHWIAVVNGDEQVVPTPTAGPTGGEPVPALSSYGIVAMVLLMVGVAVLVMWRRS
ncbi:MAG: hypothetical protein V2I67_09275 [Thermoanaerobaculales bacterium]|jgi:hypothetical protein|nr:hypothetical protein [Thermoanaerobaculales bacterium]